MTTEHELMRNVRPGMECDSGRWTEQMAENLAEADGLGRLGEEHWRVIRYLREHFVQYGAAPPMHLACVHSSLDPHCVERLFNGAREAWRIAGLPDPGAEAKTYMD
jgi:tRNA 2-thiouridine synthesizing protein E